MSRSKPVLSKKPKEISSHFPPQPPIQPDNIVLQVKYTIIARATIASPQPQPLLPIIQAPHTQLNSIALAQDPIIIQRASTALQLRVTTNHPPTHMQVILTHTHMLSTAHLQDNTIMTSITFAQQQTRVGLLVEESAGL